MPQEMAAVTFHEGQSVIHAVHGLGRVRGIEDQHVAGSTVRVYVIEIGPLILRKPVEKIGDGDLRPVSEEAVLDKVVNILKKNRKSRNGRWLHKSAQYQKEITGGDLKELATAIRDLWPTETDSNVSYSVRQLYEGAIRKLADEIAAIKGITTPEAILWLEKQTDKKFPYDGAHVPAPARFVPRKVGRPAKPRAQTALPQVKLVASETSPKLVQERKAVPTPKPLNHPDIARNRAVASRQITIAIEDERLRDNLVRATAELAQMRISHETSLDALRTELKRIALEASEATQAREAAERERNTLQEQLEARNAQFAETCALVEAQENVLQHVRVLLAASEARETRLKDELEVARSQIPPPRVTKPKPIWNPKWSGSKKK